MAPAYAVPRMLERAGLTLQDFDFYEIHEAFASQVLSTLAAWEDPVFCKERLGLDAPLGSIDRTKLNVNGSSLAAGHPFAATGGRIVNVAGQAARREGLGPRPDLDLRRRRPGRRRDPRALTTPAPRRGDRPHHRRSRGTTVVWRMSRVPWPAVTSSTSSRLRRHRLRPPGPRHPSWTVPVAVKMLRAAHRRRRPSGPGCAPRPSWAGSLHHPGIAQVYDYGEDTSAATPRRTS